MPERAKLPRGVYHSGLRFCARAGGKYLGSFDTIDEAERVAHACRQELEESVDKYRLLYMEPPKQKRISKHAGKQLGLFEEGA